jgi:hypothetical protein
VVGAITGVVATVVSAFFGIRTSQVHGTQAHRTARAAQDAADRARVDAAAAHERTTIYAERAAADGGEALARALREARLLAQQPAAADSHDALVNSIQEAAARADRLFPPEPAD